MEQEIEIDGTKYFRDSTGTLFDEKRRNVTDENILKKANETIANAPRDAMNAATSGVRNTIRSGLRNAFNRTGDTPTGNNNTNNTNNTPTSTSGNTPATPPKPDVAAKTQADNAINEANEKEENIGKTYQENTKSNLNQILQDNGVNINKIDEHYTERVARSMWDRYKSGQIDKKQFTYLLVDDLATTLGNIGAAIAALGNVELPTQQSQFDKIIESDLEGALENYNKKMNAELEEGLKNVGYSNEAIQNYEKTIADAKMSNTDKGLVQQLESLNDKYAYEVNAQIANAYRSMKKEDRTALLQYSILLGKTQPETLPELAAVLSGQMDPDKFNEIVGNITDSLGSVAGVGSDMVNKFSSLLESVYNWAMGEE